MRQLYPFKNTATIMTESRPSLNLFNMMHSIPYIFVRHLHQIICCLFILLTAANHAVANNHLTLSKEHPLRIEIKDSIDFPAYNWSRTLLSYQIEFDSQIKPEQLQLKNLASGQEVPIQLSNFKKTQSSTVLATLNFFSDLPSGSERTFELIVDDKASEEKDGEDKTLRILKSDQMIEVDADTLAVRLPNSKKFLQGDQIPGPLTSIKLDNTWLGNSLINAGSKQIKSLNTEIEESGELFVSIKLNYQFTDGASYIARLKIVSGYDFIEFEESMQGISTEDKVEVEMQWDQFHPKYRMGADWWPGSQTNDPWQRIDQPIIRAYVNEDPHWEPGWNEDPSVEMVYKLSPYGGNGVREIPPHMSFWENGANPKELGVFVLNDKMWQDGTYTIWQHSPKLQVRFRYGPNKALDSEQAEVLVWTWPISEGSRSTGIALYDVETKQAEVEKIREIYSPIEKQGLTSMRRFSIKDMQLRYTQLLRSQYGFLSLNKFKNWILEYPDDAAQPETVFASGKAQTVDEYEDALFHSSFVLYPLGLNVWPGVNSIQHRFVYSWVTDGYNRLQGDFTPEARKRINALLLLAGYITEGEEMHPIRTALAGAPNMAADGWCVPMQIAYLFPEHPMSEEWRNYYEQSVRITSHFFTRPEVPELDSKGGRWTESLGTYNWANLRPLSFSLTAGLLTDGKNRWANPAMAARGQWMVDMLSAPIYNPDTFWRQHATQKSHSPEPLPENWKVGDPLDPALGFMRQYPAHGAHGSGTTIEPPSVVWLMGEMMRNYNPILAEHLLWIETLSEDYEHNKEHADWLEVEKTLLDWRNQGTPPELHSTKYTGHGIVLRSGFGTPEELSIHMDQVDRGPNYRWGNSGEGASGSLYFFAQGKFYSAHERENAGDRTMDDTDGVTTFGVMKNGTFRSIGMNLLEQPLYDLGVAQFAELTPRKGKSAYSWPEYQSRNTFLVGTDYFILTDETLDNAANRFTWFTAKDTEFPKLFFLQPMQVRNDHWTELSTPMTKGFHRQFYGSSRVLVTHKDDVIVESITPVDLPYLEESSLKGYRKARGFRLPNGAYAVRTPTSTDLVFRNEKGVRYQEKNAVFAGEVGVIRRKESSLEMAMVHSQKIGTDGITLEVNTPELGISLISSDLPSAMGQFDSPKGGKLTIRLPRTTADLKFYIDATLTPVRAENQDLIVSLPAGAHTWELTVGTPEPMRSRIVRTGNVTGGAQIFWEAGIGTEKIALEISEDNTKTWQLLDTFDVQGEKGSWSVDGLRNDQKVHLRVTSLAKDRRAPSSPAYPLYITAEAPPAPDGLEVSLDQGQTTLSWGEVFGATSYRLYRRSTGTEAWSLLHDALDHSYIDETANGVVPAYPLPGKIDNFERDQAKIKIYQYAISAVNLNGEGPKSPVISTDPSSWLNWWPKVENLHFRRRSAYWQPPYVSESMMPPAHYPDVK